MIETRGVKIPRDFLQIREDLPDLQGSIRLIDIRLSKIHRHKPDFVI